MMHISCGTKQTLGAKKAGIGPCLYCFTCYPDLSRLKKFKYLIILDNPILDCRRVFPSHVYCNNLIKIETSKLRSLSSEHRQSNFWLSWYTVLRRLQRYVTIHKLRHGYIKHNQYNHHNQHRLDNNFKDYIISFYWSFRVSRCCKHIGKSHFRRVCHKMGKPINKDLDLTYG